MCAFLLQLSSTRSMTRMGSWEGLLHMNFESMMTMGCVALCFFGSVCTMSSHQRPGTPKACYLSKTVAKVLLEVLECSGLLKFCSLEHTEAGRSMTDFKVT
ncbi:hypothetical protein cypCar_00026154 [Cyprinus carpio]|nr:hypothetical protein cypCar_00026154 [Cyprinus carpio]